jgi:acetolactate synthase regulatory subunit
MIKERDFEVEAYNVLTKYECGFMKVSFDLETMRSLIFHFAQVGKLYRTEKFEKDVLKFKKV